ncbi:MAG TPA: DUF1573 domain-containing protein [Chryseolinea sp.]
MKKIILSLFLSAFAFVVVAQQPLASTAKPSSEFIKDDGSFNWAETSFDFGKIKVNKPVTHEFSFINAGDTPLVITSVQASCGCTVAKYSKDAIAPGASGYVTATYNAAKVGVFTKTVTVNANTGSGAVLLTVKGEVVE